MSSRQSQLIRLFLRAQKLAQRRATIESVRRMSRWSERIYSVPKDVRQEKIIQNERTYEWLIPKDVGSDKVIFYIHGGGFVFPLYNPTRYVAAYLARITGMRVFLADYRLAPEHPFPAAIEDCVTAYRWLISKESVLPEQVVFVGESAGGNLVITTMLTLQDAGDPLPSGAASICPVFDFEGGGTFYVQDDPMVAADFVMLQLNAYRGSADPRNPRLSPLYANLRGLPPLLIQIGASEILQSGAEELALRAKQAGVPTILDTWPGMWHYWHMFVPFLPEAQQAMQTINHFLHACTKQDSSEPFGDIGNTNDQDMGETLFQEEVEPEKKTRLRRNIDAV
ncbi:MAG: alpha/beta hydrolase [Anaerolineales bacterium]|nr:alpha/beta hydrolase [Anaerolineales bacterium]